MLFEYVFYHTAIGAIIRIAMFACENDVYLFLAVFFLAIIH